jgi:hypothetical protein
MNLAQGTANLVSAFAGGDATYQAAKSKAELLSIQRAGMAADTDRKVDLAIKERDSRMAIQRVAADEHLPQQMRDMIVGKIAGEYAKYELGAEREQSIGFRNDAVEAFKGGDWNLGNASLAGLSKGPLTLTDVDGGQIVRNKYSTEGTVTPTNVAESQAADHYAGVNQKNASAQASLARAAFTGDKMAHPEKYRAPSKAGGGRSSGRWTAPAVNSINSYFGNPRVPAIGKDGNPLPWTAADVVKRDGYMRNFEAWRDAHPDITSGEQALAEYKQSLRGAAASTAFGGDPTNIADLKDDAVAVAGSRANGAGTQIPTPNGAVTPKVPGVPETYGVTAVKPASAGKRDPAWVLQQIKDARAAIQGRKITREEAIRRLHAAGLSHAAAEL